MSKQSNGGLLAVSLDNPDGHKRITTAETFTVVGGSQEKHQELTEKILKMRAFLKKKGEDFDSCSKERFEEVAQNSGLFKLVRGSENDPN